MTHLAENGQGATAGFFSHTVSSEPPVSAPAPASTLPFVTASSRFSSARAPLLFSSTLSYRFDRRADLFSRDENPRTRFSLAVSLPSAFFFESSLSGLPTKGFSCHPRFFCLRAPLLFAPSLLLFRRHHELLVDDQQRAAALGEPAPSRAPFPRVVLTHALYPLAPSPAFLSSPALPHRVRASLSLSSLKYPRGNSRPKRSRRGAPCSQHVVC